MDISSSQKMETPQLPLSELRFATAGSVDHGKSTLVGRLLFDLGQLKDDQIEALQDDGSINLAFATDGLTAEREKGITIDIAWRYLQVKGRRLVCVDAPGHREYAINALTAFTQVQAVVLVMDITRHDFEQFFLHLSFCHFLGISQLAIAVNKMDAVDYSQEAYQSRIKVLMDDSRWPSGLSARFIPVSALSGEGVAQWGVAMKWYKGATLIEWLLNCKGRDEWQALASSNPWQRPESATDTLDVEVCLLKIADGQFDLPSHHWALLAEDGYYLGGTEWAMSGAVFSQQVVHLTIHTPKAEKAQLPWLSQLGRQIAITHQDTGQVLAIGFILT